MPVKQAILRRAFCFVCCHVETPLSSELLLRTDSLHPSSSSLARKPELGLRLSRDLIRLVLLVSYHTFNKLKYIFSLIWPTVQEVEK